MKKILLALAAVTAFTGSASAADLAAHPYTKSPSPPPPMIAAIYDWSGFYIGANGGWASSHKCWDQNNGGTVFAEGCHDATGGLIGGQIGYRWQGANWVFGLEAQGDWADLKGSNTSLFAPLVTNRTRIDALGLFTGQVGYAWNNILWYVKGGAAVVNDKFNGLAIGTGIVVDEARETRWGATIGTGVEFGFGPNWSVGVEYDHIFVGDRSIDFTSAGTFVRNDKITQDVDMVTARVSYRWGGLLGFRY